MREPGRAPRCHAQYVPLRSLRVAVLLARASALLVHNAGRHA
jgi:hypothetical protein